MGEITSPDIQVREIPDPEKPTGDLYVLVLNVGTAGGPPLLLAWRHSARRRKSVAWVR